MLVFSIHLPFYVNRILISEIENKNDIYQVHIYVCVCEGEIKVGNKIDRLFRGRKRKERVGCFVRDGRPISDACNRQQKIALEESSNTFPIFAVHFVRNSRRKQNSVILEIRFFAKMLSRFFFKLLFPGFSYLFVQFDISIE